MRSPYFSKLSMQMVEKEEEKKLEDCYVSKIVYFLLIMLSSKECILSLDYLSSIKINVSACPL